MSADNYLFLDRKAKKVYHCTASCVCSHKRHCLKCQKTSLVGTAKTLEGALKLAEKAEKEAEANGYLIEYGISLDLWCK